MQRYISMDANNKSTYLIRIDAIIVWFERNFGSSSSSSAIYLNESSPVAIKATGTNTTHEAISGDTEYIKIELKFILSFWLGRYAAILQDIQLQFIYYE